MKLIRIGWRKNVKFLRLFKPNGTIVEEGDLINIKRGTTLYAELSNEDIKPNII